jgi:excisionase family DNA binding protein
MVERLLPRPVPLGLSREEAAEYIGVSVNLFSEMVKDGRMPKPKHIGARRIFDRHQLDAAFAALPSEGDPAAVNPWHQGAAA